MNKTLNRRHKANESTSRASVFCAVTHPLSVIRRALRLRGRGRGGERQEWSPAGWKRHTERQMGGQTGLLPSVSVSAGSLRELLKLAARAPQSSRGLASAAAFTPDSADQPTSAHFTVNALPFLHDCRLRGSCSSLRLRLNARMMHQTLRRPSHSLLRPAVLSLHADGENQTPRFLSVCFNTEQSINHHHHTRLDPLNETYSERGSWTCPCY